MAAERNILFELINDLFACEDITKKYSDETFKQYQFMVDRIVSIKYPRQASILNYLGMNPKYSIYTLNGMLYNGRGKENWVYTKGTKKLKEESVKSKVTPKMIRDFCAWYNKDIKDVEFALKIYNNEMTSEILEFDEMIKRSQEKN